MSRRWRDRAPSSRLLHRFQCDEEFTPRRMSLSLSTYVLTATRHHHPYDTTYVRPLHLPSTFPGSTTTLPRFKRESEGLLCPNMPSVLRFEQRRAFPGTSPEDEPVTLVFWVSTFPLPPPAPKTSVMLVFGVSTFVWPPPAPKTSVTARLQGFDLSLATTNPENECACSSSGF